MAGISLAHSHPRPCSGEKTLKRCRHEKAEDVILIDVDSESFENVIIIDIPESLPPKKNKGSSMLRKDNWPFSNVINIDDDDDDDDGIPDSSNFVGVNNARFSAGTSSSRESIRVAQKDSADAAVEDCQFGQDKATPVRLSKCKRTYSGNFFRKRNRYGLGDDSEFDSSDEVVEDTSGKVQEEWEKAFSKRRKDINNVQSGTRHCDGTSGYINKDYHQNVKSKDGTRQHKETSTFSPDISIDEIDAQAFYRTKVDTSFGCTRFSDDAIHDQQSDKFACGRFTKFCPSVHFEPGNSCCHGDGSRKNPSTSNFASREESKFDHPIPIVEDEQPSEVEPSPPIPDLPVEEDSCIGKFGPIESEATIYKSKSSFEREINQGRSFPKDNHGNVQEMATRIVEETDHLRYRHSQEVGSHKETRLQEDDSMSNIQQQENKDDLPSQSGDTQETCIITDREKLKETDEYKRADEEEWASRQQALQIQSEEAHRQRQLRKRRRAERMRLLDMERRQKQRIEEVRNIQKKDEENMNLKETIRGEVRNELKKLETQCKNMASLLQSLGIKVGSWPNPSPQEIQAAYKRAMLTFHPDRAPQSDMRKQVEAEEKFKLVNRIKEKLRLQGKWVVT